MSNVPDTRKSLILRLRHPDDAEAWEEFVAIYEPLMLQLGRRRGMQDADLEETIQQVLISVAGAIVRWSPDAQGRFRSWLSRIFRNQMIDHFRKRSRQAVTGGPDFSAIPDRCLDESLAEEIEREYRRVLFRQTAADVRKQVQGATWEAFWRTAVNGEEVSQVAEALGMSEGAVYAARSRVVARIRVSVQQREARDEM